MRSGARTVVAILVYLALDLCFASVPGAFVFEARDSVETVQRSRVQDAEVSVSAFARDPRDVVTLPQPAPRRPVPETNVAALPWAPLRTGADRSSTASELPSSEDSH